MVRARLWVAAGAALLALCTACVPSEADPAAGSVEEDVPRFDEATTLGAIQQEGVLVVGVEPDAPPLSSAAGGRKPRGLAVDIASRVAEALGVEPRFRSQSARELVEGVEDGAIDLAFPVAPITAGGLRRMTWTNPYWIGHQRLLVRGGSGISETSDLRGKRVCAAINPLTGLWPVQLNNRSVPVDKGGIEKCFAALQRGEVDVVTGPDIALLSVIEPSSDYRLAGDQLTTEGYGAMVAPGAVNAAQFVNNVMNAAKADGSFDRWYRRWIGPRYNGALPGPPRFSAEEVAAFFPEEPTESG